MEINTKGKNDKMTLTVATAECFTHGIIAREIHACTQGYQGEFGPRVLRSETLKNLQEEVILLCGMFIPTLSALKSVLNVDPPQPHKIIREIKVYHEEDDQEVALLMADAIRNITGADIGIGTTAGVGKGGIAIVTNEFSVKITSDVYADLCSSDSHQLLLRQKSGIEKTLILLEEFLTH
ncbi:FeGP cofactor biosynthesis protein HcgF family protein [Methanobacterium sp. MZD130B]|jgi:uncharacterized protein (UPF0254 family)|uniref:FeGP cofactor biosynthesis protein HcgF family protein n=1 Tax=Methanobacterium sp. MZD130B TaxID=3394378 RepID=UPI0039FD32AF